MRINYSWVLGAGVAMALALITLIILGARRQWVAALGSIIDENTPAIPFLVSMAVLPALGFPVSVFLMISGVKFGVWGALAVSAAFYPVHLAFSFFIVKSLLKKRVVVYLTNRGYKTPRIPGNRMIFYGGMFAAIPGIPYAPKNYLLAMTNMPFRLYIAICWPIHILTGIPFIFLGKSAETMDVYWASASLLLLIAGYCVTMRLKQRYYDARSINDEQ